MKIDIHTHILPRSWPDLEKKYGYKGWLKMVHDANGREANLFMDDGKFFRKVSRNCWNLESRLGDMERCKVDVQVLSTVPVMFNYWAKPDDCLDLCRFLNDDIADSVAKYPSKFAGLATIPLQAPELCVEELKRIKGVSGLYGIEIGTHVGDMDLNDQAFDPIYKTCADLNIPIFVHPWDMNQFPRYSKFWLPWLVGMPSETSTAILCMLMGGVFLRFPNLKVCFAHGGGSYPYTKGRIEHGFNVRPDLCAQECSVALSTFDGSIYTDSLVHNDASLQFLTNVIGEKKVCLGSDYPFPLGEHVPGSLYEHNYTLTSEQKELGLWKNTAEFLSLPDYYHSWTDKTKD